MSAIRFARLRTAAAKLDSTVRRSRVSNAVREDQAQSIVEFALCLPALLMVVTGITTFGIAMNNYIQLTNATDVAARQLALQRGQGTDPCLTAYNALIAAAPLLKSSSLTVTYIINGTTYSVNTCNGALPLVQGSSAQVTVTYPASLKIYGKTISSSFNLKAQTAEYMQ